MEQITKSLIFDKLEHLQLKIKNNELTQDELKRIYTWITDADNHLEEYYFRKDVRSRKSQNPV
jgi:hypothetical protein